jgi:hypothetical protein
MTPYSPLPLPYDLSLMHSLPILGILLSFTGNARTSYLLFFNVLDAIFEIFLNHSCLRIPQSHIIYYCNIPRLDRLHHNIIIILLQLLFLSDQKAETQARGVRERASEWVMSSCLTWLPADLLHLLEDFLTTKDFLSLLHTNQILRREYHHLRYISLDRKHSRMYAEDEEFRVRVQSVMT